MHGTPDEHMQYLVEHTPGVCKPRVSRHNGGWYSMRTHRDHGQSFLRVLRLCPRRTSASWSYGDRL